MKASKHQHELGKSESEKYGLWSAVWAMSLCAMALIAAEFLPVSLLTPISNDLNITEGIAGQSIAISGLFVFITCVMLTSWIRQFDRRSVLLFFTLMIICSIVFVASAQSPF